MSLKEYNEIQLVPSGWKVLMVVVTCLHGGVVGILLPYLVYVKSDHFDLLPRILIPLFLFSPLLILTVMIWNSKLVLRIDNEGIHYRFSPFHTKERFWPWKRVAEVKLTKYDDWQGYGNMGLCAYIPGKGWAYFIDGAQGLQITVNNRKKILIGTQKPKELQVYLNSINL